jgi:hypothetical protein
MVIADIITQLAPRVQTLGLTDTATGFVDHTEIETYVQDALRYLANRYQLQMFLEINRNILTTVAGVESYVMPDHYGFWAPEETHRSGLAVAETDGTDVTNLTYYDPARFNLLFSATSPGRPSSFTLANGLLYFYPVPDQAYTIQGLIRGSQEHTSNIAEPYVAAVKVETLYRMAADRGKLAPPLADERRELLQALVNGESRTRQRFYTSRERIGRRRW